jgi:3-dehydroquinate synthase
MRSDKKVRDGQVRFVLATEPGKWQCVEVAESVIREHLEAWAARSRVERG